MNTAHAVRVLRKATVSTLLATLLLVGCGGGDKPENALVSAKDYLANNDRKAAVIQLKNALQKDPDLAEARFLLGKALMETGDPTGAEVELRKAQALKYPTDQVTPVLARALLMLGHADQVTNDLAKVELSSSDARAELQTVIGQAYLTQGKVEPAATAYAAALTARPGYAPALMGQARLKAGTGDFKAALALLDDALAKSPDLYDAWQLRGQLLSTQGDNPGALAAYRKTLEIKPDFLPAYSSLISLLLATNQFEEATKQIEEMKKLAPNHPRTTFLVAAMAYQQKNFPAAKDAVLLHLKATPDSPNGLQLAGLIEYEQKAYTQAEAYLARALAGSPQLSMARRALIAIYLRTGRPAKALATLEPVLDRIDKNPNMLALAGQVFMQNGQVEKAGAYFAKASALDPQNPGNRTSLAMVNLAKGDTESAFHDLEQVAATDTGNRADLALIAAHMQRKQFDQALKAIAVLEKKQPDDPLTHNLRAMALLSTKDVAGARKSLEKALSFNQAYMPAVMTLANLDLADKKPEEAKKRFESVLAKDPKNVQAMLAMAEIALKTGATTEEIAALINRAVTADPSDPGPRLALVGLYMGRKDFKKAVAVGQDAVAALPDRPEILDAAGRAQQAAENHDQALNTYRKLASVKPDSPQPYLRMAEVQLASKDKAGARDSLRKALDVKSDSLEAQRGLMMLEIDAGQLPNAIAVARNVQKQRPKEAVGYVLEGDAYALKKAWPEAIAAYRNGLKQVVATELAIKLHSALVASGNVVEADKYAEGWLKDRAKDVAFRLYLAEAASARKDYVGAGKHYRFLLDLQPDNPAVLNNLAWASNQLKDPKAIEYAEKANKLAPNQPALMDTLGVILSDKGESARGLDLFKKALELAPQAAQIRLNYAKALIKAGQKGEAKIQLDQLTKLGDKFAGQTEVLQLSKDL
ncbi:MAG TPA: PEP-CTERM system TPR-repeat protein PrsT [Accumulibacter sp.]|jgi:putative PEP-CTERM system TPR-repeat lipoprotein|nr:PEP-CTERM system TPR-repeat protein PrsT [Accumulibacter sp.]HQC79278.1 PEP-CTERM system TPR-repeat protein PrsT [Accumulibacter sp.]